MKKLFFKSMLVLAFASVVVACSEEDDDNGTGGSIVGTWDVTSEVSLASQNGVPIFGDTTNYAPGTYFFTFAANGNAYTSSSDSLGTELDTVQYNYSGTTLTVYSEDLGTRDTTVLNAVISGNNLTMSQSGVDTLSVNPPILIDFSYTIKATRR